MYDKSCDIKLQPVVVQKFGGTSVGSIDKIRHVAQIIAAEYASNMVLVVVSAMAGVTDQLVSYVDQIDDTRALTHLTEYNAEYDTILAAGEQVTCGLLAVALMQLGYKARSYLGWQVPIYTDSHYSQAKILDIPVGKIMTSLEVGEIPVLAGFQGVHDNRIMTLGRGGSDTTAVAVAAAFRAKRCDIFTDVNGVYDADPRFVSNAHKLDCITYQEMLAMAAAGAKILHPRAASIAMQHNLDLRILSTFFEENSDDSINGTIIKRKDQNMETKTIVAIVNNNQIIAVMLKKVADMNKIISNFNDASIALDGLCWHDSMVVLTFATENWSRAISCLNNLLDCYESKTIREDLATVSIVGVGIKNNLDILSRALQIMEENNFKLELLNIADDRMTFFVSSNEHTKLTQIFYENFN